MFSLNIPEYSIQITLLLFLWKVNSLNLRWPLNGSSEAADREYTKMVDLCKTAQISINLWLCSILLWALKILQLKMQLHPWEILFLQTLLSLDTSTMEVLHSFKICKQMGKSNSLTGLCRPFLYSKRQLTTKFLLIRMALRQFNTVIKRLWLSLQMSQRILLQ